MIASPSAASNSTESQRQPHKGLAQQIAEQQTMFDLLQAVAGRLAHRRIRLMLGIGKGDQQRLGFRSAEWPSSVTAASRALASG
ncbi:Uncharacterised protein [Klebsiella pneumoniae]|uniref:Uncharacterized protein n=1 Tax=Klebsiella pneumoniae TaxID=573 RepID=A0A377V2W9_KLEPN|nr:Uncharacterised protein [Klebsiella pneumoniae]